MTRGLGSSTDDDDTETILGDRISKTAVSQAPGAPDILVRGVSTLDDGINLSTTVTPGDTSSLLVDGKAVTIRSQIQFYAMYVHFRHSDGITANWYIY